MVVYHTNSFYYIFLQFTGAFYWVLSHFRAIQQLADYHLAQGHGDGCYYHYYHFKKIKVSCRPASLELAGLHCVFVKDTCQSSESF